MATCLGDVLDNPKIRYRCDFSASCTKEPEMLDGGQADVSWHSRSMMRDVTSLFEARCCLADFLASLTETMEYYGGRLFYLQLELSCLQLSFFAYTPFKHLLDTHTL